MAAMKKDEYIKEIVNMLENCNDLDLLDLIYRIISNSLANQV